MAKMLLRYVGEFIDRHGKPHRYFRRAGKRVRLPGLPGSAEFMAVYQAALDGAPAPKAEATAPRTAPGTVHWLVSAYLSSETFKVLAPETRRTRANILENVRTADGDKRIFHNINGKPVMLLAHHHLQTIINKKSITPFAQRNLLNTLRAMFRWAVSEGKLPEDPTVGVTRQRLKNTTEGYRTWTEAEIERFIARHPIGTKPYLALMLALDTGQRRGDVVRMGLQHIRHDLLPKQRHGYLCIVQGKTETLVEVPVTDALQAAIDACPSNHLTFLASDERRDRRWDQEGHIVNRSAKPSGVGLAIRTKSNGKSTTKISIGGPGSSAHLQESQRLTVTNHPISAL
jgi:hypothetical protein